MASLVGAARHRAPVKVLDVLHDVAVPHVEHRREVHADRGLLCPVVRDDVGPPGLILVGAHEREGGRGTAPFITTRTSPARLRFPRPEGPRGVGCMLPVGQGRDAVEPVVGPGLTAHAGVGQHHGPCIIIDQVAAHGRRGPPVDVEAADEVVVLQQDIAVRAGALGISDLGGHFVGTEPRRHLPIGVIATDHDVAGRRRAADQDFVVSVDGRTDRAVAEQDIPLDVEPAEAAVRGRGIHVQAVRLVIEHDVIGDGYGAGGHIVLQIEAVVQVEMRPVVVDEAAVDRGLGRGGVQRGKARHAGVRPIVNDEIDEAILHAGVDFDEILVIGARVGLPCARDLEAPKPRIRARDAEAFRHDGTLAGKLAHHDGCVSRSSQLAEKFAARRAARVPARAQPNRTARRDRRRLAQGRLQVPRLGDRSVARR